MTCFLLSFTINAAAEVQITKVSALTGRAFFGDTIPAKYYFAGNPTSITFNYFDSFTTPTCGLNVDSDSIIPNPNAMKLYDFVVYKATFPAVNHILEYVTIDDFYLRFGDYARGGFSLSCYVDGVTTSAWNDARNYPDNYCGAFPAVCANSDVSAALANYYGIMYFDAKQDGNNLTYRNIYYSFDNGGVLDSLSFSGISPLWDPAGNALFLVVICPYIGSSMSGDPPAATTTTETSSPSTGTSIVVDVDMDETNSLLGQIKQAILGIVEGIKGLFIPDPEYIEDFKEFFLGTDDDPGFLEDHLGGLYEAVELIDEFIESLLDITPHATFHVPAASIPLAGTNFQVGNWDLSVESEAIPQAAYEALKWLIDFLATAAFLNMCKYKLEIFLNPDTEVVKEE